MLTGFLNESACPTVRPFRRKNQKCLTLMGSDKTTSSSTRLLCPPITHRRNCRHAPNLPPSLPPRESSDDRKYVCCIFVAFQNKRNVSVKSKLQHAPPGHTPGIWHLCRPGEEGIWLSESSRGWGIWTPCFRGGEFELHPRFHVKSLAWWAIMGDAVLEDFRGKDCAFVANWLRGKGLNKLCAVFEVFKF